MSLDALVDLIHTPGLEEWTDRNKRAFESLFGSPDGRYPVRAKSLLSLRAPALKADNGVAFSAFIHHTNASSGPYSGLSFVMFPVEDAPALFGLVIGTHGVAPDDAILGRPGHARKAQAIAAWLNDKHESSGLVAWAKHDPTRTDVAVPPNVTRAWSEYQAAFDRYGKEMYALYKPSSDRDETRRALAAFLDLLLQERGFEPVAGKRAECEEIRTAWFAKLMPMTEVEDVAELLLARRYVVLQGPPGTGKTRMALELLRTEYRNRGRSIQFHPNTSYETFIGGLAPTLGSSDLGLRFSPAPGELMRAAAKARETDGTYLLHIDEINRADLGKVLGEAMYLLEPDADLPRRIHLPYDFGEGFGEEMELPSNLHILGTMNSADRSIAIVDIAVRRRFAFQSVWPQTGVVEQYGSPLMQNAFRELLSIFVEHANADAFTLVPGHSYFLEKDDARARQRLRTGLAPLLEEYLSQGYVTGFSEQIRAYLQEWAIH